MASADWAALTAALDTTNLRRGVTAGQTPPNGGGSFVYGFASAAVVEGAAGLVYNGLVNFNPTPASTLGRISGCVVRRPSGGTTGFAPMLYLGLQTGAVTGSGYLLGLQDDDPSSIVLRKGPLDEGLPAGAVGESGILLKSTDSVEVDEWVHLRLEAVVNGTGDVVLNVYRNDLDANPVTAPVWAAVPGMSQFIDDALGVNSGSLPYTSGRFGIAMFVNNISRRSAFDHIEIARQLP